MKKKRITCACIRNHLCAELDEGMNSPACRKIKKHLSGCPDCTAYLKDLKKTIRLYNEYPEVRISRSAENRLLRSVFESNCINQPANMRRNKNPNPKR